MKSAMRLMFLFCVVSNLFWAACSHGPSMTGDKKPAEPSASHDATGFDENTVGQMMAAQLAGEFGMVLSDASAIKYINLIGQTLVEQAGRPGLRFRFGILNTDRLETFSTPSGHVFVSKGLLRVLENEHELAGFLAAQIAHINEGHHRQIFGYDSTREMKLGEVREVEAGMAKLMTEGFSKELELEADAASAIYLATTGYSPQQWANAMKRLSKLPQIKKSTSLRWISDRAFRLEGFLQRNGLAGASFADEKVLKSRFKTRLERVRR